ncbi:MAG: hypothetical protein IKU53_04885 [Firmicutes bacterium]|nr:hypothetical protein [Bacillota bacterium]
MKKKYLKIVALVVALCLIAGLLLFANALLGNPVSKMLATNTATKYVEETYQGTDYYIEDVSYSFKDGYYHAFVKSPTSIDTQFSLYINMFGNLSRDTYEDVDSGFVTAQRLDTEYRNLTDTVFASAAFPTGADITFGALEIHPEEYLNNPEFYDIPPYSLNQTELEKDKIYDIKEIGSKAGHLTVHIKSDQVTVENASQILLAIKEQFDSAGIPFVAIDFKLQSSTEEGTAGEQYIGVANFLSEDIYEVGLLERVEKADQELKAFYAKLDKEK